MDAEPTESTKPAETGEPTEKVEQRSRDERGFWGLVAKATALVVLISGIVTLVYKVWPTPTPVLGAKISNVTVESGLTFRQYLDEVGEEPGNLSKKVLARKGALIQFTVEATGYRSKHLNLKWEVIDVGTHDRMLKSDAITITPGADTDSLNTAPAFAPFPKGGGPFEAHGELFAPDGVSLATAEKDFEAG
jgi:hypothetical protein